MSKRTGVILAAALATAAVPATIVFAQTQSPPAKEHRARLSPDARSRLLEGRLAMAKTALKLNDEQAQLWSPVEQLIRNSAAQREKRWEEFRAKREEFRAKREAGATGQRPSLPDRLDRASQRLAQRAERLKAFAAVFKPFYDSLNDEQKVIAGVVLRQVHADGVRGHGHRWAFRRAPGEGSQKQ